MRFGDLDALKEKIWRSDVSTREKISNLIDNAPTVELPVAQYDSYSKGFYDGRACAESASGTWKYKKYDYYCSNCGNNALELNDYPYLSAYCPFCGAEMEIEQ